MIITARKLQCYELLHEGKPIGLFRVDGKWMGMVALRDVASDDVVIADLGGRGTNVEAFDAIWAELWAEDMSIQIRIVRASESIAILLGKADA